MVKPKPVPPYLRFISTEPCEKLSKTVSSLSLGMPTGIYYFKDTIAFVMILI
jgi:hypothetical protein